MSLQNYKLGYFFIIHFHRSPAVILDQCDILNTVCKICNMCYQKCIYPRLCNPVSQISNKIKTIDAVKL